MIFFPIFLYFNKFTSILIKIFQCIGLFEKKEDKERDYFNEKIGEYWECIIGQEQKRWFTKETHMRNKLNIK